MGKSFICSKCRLIHIEYKNIGFTFSDKEFRSFSYYFLKIEGEFWEIINLNSQFRRKIFISIGDKNFNILLYTDEVLEIKKLLKNTFKNPRISSFIFFSKN